MAMEECISLNVYNYNIVKGHITSYKKPKQEQLHLFNIELPQANIKRNLGEYQI